jgi:DNA adenine methylase
MQFMGGKARIARRLEAEIRIRSAGRTAFIEPFLGGAHVLPLLRDGFSYRGAGEVHEDLALLWQEARDGWVPPEAVSRELYASLRHAPPSALRGFVGYGCSFGGKWFGGYASNARGDDFCGAARRGVLRKAAGLEGSLIHQRDYREWTPDASTVVYCDPPYAGTTPYTGAPGWQPLAFWGVMEKWVAAGAIVLVSEYTAPEGWDTALEFPVKVSLRKDSNTLTATEKLFVKKG